MALRKRHTFLGRAGVVEGRDGELTTPENSKHRNRKRRVQYASDPEYAAKTKQASIDYYRKDHPLPPPLLAHGLLTVGQEKQLYTLNREVRYETTGYVECYSIPKAAEALGRTELSIKKWLREGILPPPIWFDVDRGFKRYTVGELRTIASVIAQHEGNFVYISARHTETVSALWRAIQLFRASHI